MDIIDKCIDEIGLPIPIKQYYQCLEFKARTDFEVGQIVYAIISYPTQKDIKMLNVVSYDPTQAEKAKYEIVDFNFKKFSNSSHRPIHGDNLEHDEIYVLQKGKMRPCVILNKVQSIFDNSLYPENIYLCAPIFSFKEKHEDKYMLDILKFSIEDCFFLPKDTKGLKNHSVVRFSRILPLHFKNLEPYSCLLERKKPLALSDEAFNLLVYHLSNYLSVSRKTDEIALIIKEYADLI